MTDGWPRVTYDQAFAAYDAGQKLYLAGHKFLVRRALRTPQRPGGRPAQPGSAPAVQPVLWVVDELTAGDHGLLLYPDGQIVSK